MLFLCACHPPFNFQPTKNPTEPPTNSPTTPSPTACEGRKWYYSPQTNGCTNAIYEDLSQHHLFDTLQDCCGALQGEHCVYYDSCAPTAAPSTGPTAGPTRTPTTSPTTNPSGSPTNSPTGNPSRSPTKTPTGSPTKNPSQSVSGIALSERR